MVLETRYVPGGKYTIAFFLVEPLHPAPQRLPSLIAAWMAAVESVAPVGSAW